MYISRLPNELLVNIVGRLDFDSVGSVLFLNKKFSNLVEVHRLYKPVAEQLTVNVVQSLTKKPFYNLFVKARLAPKWPQGDKRKLKIRKQIEKLRIYEKDKEQIEEKLLAMIKKLQIYQTPCLLIDHHSLDFDIMNTILDAGLNTDILEEIRTSGFIDARCITKKHFDKLFLLDKKNALGRPRPLNFENCTTSIRFEEVLNHINLHFEKMEDHCSWDFGVFTLNSTESNKIQELVARIILRTKVEDVNYYRFKDYGNPNPTFYRHRLQYVPKNAYIRFYERSQL